jgi:hypothetical protein
MNAGGRRFSPVLTAASAGVQNRIDSAPAKQ